MTDINQLSPWPLLKAHHQKLAATPLSGLFAQDTARFDKLSLRLPGLLADYSKNHITEETLSLLVSLARAAALEKRRDAMFAGERINQTENRAVLHTALRAAADTQITVDGENVVLSIQETLARMGAFADAVRSGNWKGHSGKEITDIVNIGIGGSSLGPQLVCEALGAFHHPRLRAHYVANVEASDLGGTLRRIDPETTLFIVASKTFTTAETMQNANIARDWLLAHYKGDHAVVAKHFVATSTNTAAVAAFGIAPENMFPFQDWVGGRYSVWSSIGLSVTLMVGRINSPISSRARAIWIRISKPRHLKRTCRCSWASLVFGTATCAITLRWRLFRTTPRCAACPRFCSSSTWKATASA
jgi:glucose-6-phosphate isomerase